jgi:YidC/Oxa1 family membrane protein insertase
MELEGEGSAAPRVVFRYAPGTGVVFTKRVSAIPGTWELALEIGIENRAAGEGGRREFVLVPAGCVPAELGDNFYPEPRAVAVGRDDDGELEIEWESAPVDSGGTLDVPAPLVFAGAHNKYFAFFLRGAEASDRATLTSAGYAPVRADLPPGETVQRDLVVTNVHLGLSLPPEGESRTWSYRVYAGPKDREQIVAALPEHAIVLDEDLSTFSTIGRGLLVVLGFFHGLVGNWGVAIILLTICVRLVLFPLNRRSQTAMTRYQKKMKRVQPKLEEVKKRFKDEPQKQREAQARIMQEEGAFPPLGGCLPVFVQIPIFFGLFSALRTSFDLRQAPFFLWIDDLSRPDRLLELDLDLLFFRVEYLNLLPLLMVVLWILQQRGMPKPADEQAARMQKMMMFMPVFMGFFLYNYAAGLSLYMITQSVLGIAEQTIIKRRWPVDDIEPPKKTGGFMARLAEKQKEQMKRLQQREARKRAAQKKRVKSVGAGWWRRGVSGRAGGACRPAEGA